MTTCKKCNQELNCEFDDVQGELCFGCLWRDYKDKNYEKIDVTPVN